MSEKERDELDKQRDKIVAELEAQFPDQKEQIPHLVDEFLITLSRIAGDGIKTGYEMGWDTARKANKISLFVRTTAALVVSPPFIMFGSKLVGENMFALFLGGLAASTVFYVAEEAIQSLYKLIKGK